jgi:hypothetical protein
MFARAVPALRLIVALFAAIVLAGCGQERQDADEPSGDFRVDVADASFPAKQHIAEQSTMRIRVRNPDKETVPNVAVTVQTKPSDPGQGPIAFAQSKGDPRLADPSRAVWILDREPKGGTSAYTNTWVLGPLKSGESKTFEWKLTPVQAGDYSITYRISPGLDNKARLADGSKATGTFTVNVSDKPVPARVNSKGQVVRGEKAGAGKD